ncbi:O-antigen ligase family protein [Pseudarthrobacter sp. L19]|uniref:O-antigen ligase family protein n=1 Tax=Pseudarthrobacter sp. L19 TaxID=3423951 RepID=UPI003D793999
MAAAFVLLTLAVPLVMIPSGLYRFELPKILLMSLAVAAALIVPSSGALSLRAKWLLGGVLAAILVAALFSGNPLLGIVGRWPRYDGLLLSTVYAGLVAGGARVFGGAGGADARLLWARGTSVVMIALAPLALSEALGARPLGGAVDVRPGATLGNATDLGIVALVGCVSLLPLAIRPKNWLMNLGAAAGALSSICSGSRAVIIALVIALLILAAQTLYASFRIRRLGATAAAVLGFLGACVVVVFAVPATAHRLFSAQTVSGRWLLWQQSMKLITDHLVLGVGPGLFVDLFPRYQSDSFARQVGTEFPADSPHMLPLELLAAGGFPFC